MKISVGSDEDSALLGALRGLLVRRGHEVLEPLTAGEPWPQVGRAVGEDVAGGRAEVGIVCCWTGTGVAMAATKVPGVRAALCGDAETARGARRWNDANVLALSNRLVTPAVAGEIVEAFLSTVDVDPEEQANIDSLG